jgi:3',5'-cyclic AMP phosphodiesterase CpdA
MLRRTLPALLCALLASGQAARPFFVQLADPQFGAVTGNGDFSQETANYEFAVANINRLKPQFVVICGDLINKEGDPAQLAEFKRITARIDPSIAVYTVAGNHDVGNNPTQALVADYRRNIGPDYYSFRQGEIYGLVLNSSVISAPEQVQAIANEQEAWLREELTKARASGAKHVVVFQHHSWFLEKPDEPAQYFNIPLEQRQRYLKLLKDSGVRYVFAGHYHRNALGRDGDLEMVTNGPVSRPLGTDPTGMRLVTVFENRLEHRYFTLGEIPYRFPGTTR